MVPPLLLKGALGGRLGALWDPPTRTLHGTGICVFLYVGGWDDLGQGGNSSGGSPLTPYRDFRSLTSWRVGIRPGEHSAALVSVFLLVFLWVGTILG